jgi:predicted regulator of amino acid metabolism with ACT domain
MEIIRMSEDSLDDIMRGIKPFAKFLNITETQGYRIIERKIVPSGRDGKIIITSKRRVTAALDKIAAGEAD